MRLLLRWLLSSGIGFALAQGVPALGVHFDSIGTALWVMLLMGLLSATLGLLLKLVLSVAFLAIPILGWIALVAVDALVTAVLFSAVAHLVVGFAVEGFISAFIFGALVSAITGVLVRVLSPRKRKN